jgi:hypothetical protein
MKLNVDDLRRHYASLSDEALRAINRTELVEIAQQCYDQELAQRAPLRKIHAIPSPQDENEGEFEDAWESNSENAPRWVAEAVCVCNFLDYPGQNAGSAAGDARSALEKAGIPCYLEQRPVEPDTPRVLPQNEYRVLVPARLNLQAISVLDKEIYNSENEEAWRAHFRALSDEELVKTKREDFVAGLLDLVDRITNAYNEEVTRRTKTSHQ